MTINYTALKTELNTDPVAYGYAALIAQGNDQGLADLLNLVRDGSNGGPAITVKRADISAQELLEAIDTRDLPASVTPAMSWFESATQVSRLRLVDENGNNTRVMGNLRRILSDTNGSQTRLVALASRNGSRAEQLFGAGTYILAYDVAIALRQTP